MRRGPGKDVSTAVDWFSDSDRRARAPGGCTRARPVDPGLEASWNQGKFFGDPLTRVHVAGGGGGEASGGEGSRTAEYTPSPLV